MYPPSEELTYSKDADFQPSPELLQFAESRRLAGAGGTTSNASSLHNSASSKLKVSLSSTSTYFGMTSGHEPSPVSTGPTATIPPQTLGLANASAILSPASSAAAKRPGNASIGYSREKVNMLPVATTGLSANTIKTTNISVSSSLYPHSNNMGTDISGVSSVGTSSSSFNHFGSQNHTRQSTRALSHATDDSGLYNFSSSIFGSNGGSGSVRSGGGGSGIDDSILGDLASASLKHLGIDVQADDNVFYRDHMSTGRFDEANNSSSLRGFKSNTSLEMDDPLHRALGALSDSVLSSPDRTVFGKSFDQSSLHGISQNSPLYSQNQRSNLSTPGLSGTSLGYQPPTQQQQPPISSSFSGYGMGQSGNSSISQSGYGNSSLNQNQSAGLANQFSSWGHESGMNTNMTSSSSSVVSAPTSPVAQKMPYPRPPQVSGISGMGMPRPLNEVSNFQIGFGNPLGSPSSNPLLFQPQSTNNSQPNHSMYGFNSNGQQPPPSGSSIYNINSSTPQYSSQAGFMHMHPSLSLNTQNQLTSSGLLSKSLTVSPVPSSSGISLADTSLPQMQSAMPPAQQGIDGDVVTDNLFVGVNWLRGYDMFMYRWAGDANDWTEFAMHIPPQIESILLGNNGSNIMEIERISGCSMRREEEMLRGKKEAFLVFVRGPTGHPSNNNMNIALDHISHFMSQLIGANGVVPISSPSSQPENHDFSQNNHISWIPTTIGGHAIGPGDDGTTSSSSSSHSNGIGQGPSVTIISRTLEVPNEALQTLSGKAMEWGNRLGIKIQYKGEKGSDRRVHILEIQGLPEGVEQGSQLILDTMRTIQ
jgi:hypothetical protein